MFACWRFIVVVLSYVLSCVVCGLTLLLSAGVVVFVCLFVDRCCLLFVARCVLLVVCCMLLAACCSLSVACCSWWVACCLSLSIVAGGSLLVVCCWLGVVVCWCLFGDDVGCCVSSVELLFVDDVVVVC